PDQRALVSFPPLSGPAISNYLKNQHYFATLRNWPRKVKNLCRRGRRVWRVVDRALPAQENRTPGEAAAHRLEQHEVALPDATVGDGRAERQRHRGGRGVAVQVDGDDDLVPGDAELPGRGVDDALVGLVR